MHRTHSDRRPTRPPAYLPGGSRGARCGWPESAGRWLVVMGFGGWIEWDESVDACIQCGHGRTPPAPRIVRVRTTRRHPSKLPTHPCAASGSAAGSDSGAAPTTRSRRPARRPGRRRRRRPIPARRRRRWVASVRYVGWQSGHRDAPARPCGYRAAGVMLSLMDACVVWCDDSIGLWMDRPSSSSSCVDD